MKSLSKMAIAALAGLALGAMAVQAIHAQAKPPAYYVAEIEVTDAAVYNNEFASKIPPTLQPFGGHYLVRGGNPAKIDGEPPKGRIVAIGFDSLEKAQAWRDSRTRDRRY